MPTILPNGKQLDKGRARGRAIRCRKSHCEVCGGNEHGEYITCPVIKRLREQEERERKRWAWWELSDDCNDHGRDRTRISKNGVPVYSETALLIPSQTIARRYGLPEAETEEGEIEE